jgi:hypothetical protein
MCHNLAALTQKQMGGHMTSRRLVYGYNYYHSISKLWSYSQHCFQGGYCILCHNWQYPALHTPGLHKNVILKFGKESKMGVRQTYFLYV